MEQVILDVKNLKKHYPVKKAFKDTLYVKALDGVSFQVNKGKMLGIVGESGCGKSTLAKALMNLETPTDGSVIYDGIEQNSISRKDLLSTVQMVFQDPYNSLNPRKKAWQLIAEPLFINTNLSKKECYAKAVKMMETVGLRPELANRYPHMFSGGQRQRLGVARALISNPKVLICDEPISALDVSIQAQVLNLIMDLQDNLELTCLFISHDLHVVNHICDEIIVMYLGKIVEYGSRDEIFNNPKHPYTKALLASTPSISSANREHTPIEGELPSPLNPPTGCAFHKRCPNAKEECSKTTPKLEMKEDRFVACLEV